MAEADDKITSYTVMTVDDLPETVLVHILSFLPTLDAIQTTVISPRWRDLWTSLPSLSFDFSLFVPPCDTPSETLQAFADFVNRALILRPHSDLRSLSLLFDSTAEHRRYRHHIESWIRYAVDHNVDHLSLAFDPMYVRKYDAAEFETIYYFPFYFLRNSSVRYLILKRCNLELPENVARMRFEALRSIFLEQIYLTDQIISDLVSGCLNIENLTIRCCYGMKNLKISSPMLRDLGLFYFKCEQGSVEICAPNLRKLSISFFEVEKYTMADSSALEEAFVCCFYMAEYYQHWSKIVRLLGHVKHLQVQNWWYKAVAAKDFLSKSFIFYNLNYLKLQTMYTKADLLGIAALLEFSPQLETMILDRDYRLDEEDFGGNISEEFDTINFCIPSLRQLKLSCYWGCRDELHFLRLVLKSEVVLERIVLLPVIMHETPVTPIVLTKQSLGFQVVQGSFPGRSLHIYQRIETSV